MTVGDQKPANSADQWPSLDLLRLSDTSLVERRGIIGGSDANTILSGNAERVVELWQVKRGGAPTEDLSSVLPVMLGCWTEALNRQWYERLFGLSVSACGDSYTCSRHDWRRCTIDGLVAPGDVVFEAKHTSAFAKAEEVLERYMPQLQHNMAVTGRKRAVLSVIFGNHKYETFEIAADWLYQLELLDAEAAFWDCVQSGREPVPAAVPPPPRPVGTREVCLEGNNAWAFAAIDWLEHRVAAKQHCAAVSAIKGLVDDDVARAFGHGVEARRSKSGAILIRELAP